MTEARVDRSRVDTAAGLPDHDPEPGEAYVLRVGDQRVVLQADPIIRVAVELIAPDGLDAGIVEDDGTLRLDTAGVYRYRFLRAESEHTHLYQRIDETADQADTAVSRDG